MFEDSLRYKRSVFHETNISFCDSSWTIRGEGRFRVFSCIIDHIYYYVLSGFNSNVAPIKSMGSVRPPDDEFYKVSFLSKLLTLLALSMSWAVICFEAGPGFLLTA